ncbi:MAG: hypothetical protein A2V99_03125 [Spirochaetes bacterium RBG_16_67_19]|nr:MAG: hypothetical protein A2V99_03125 [Spirochaetes bacterium RBG_16_67_19]
MKPVRWILLLLSLWGFPGPASYGYPPTLLLGVQGGGIWFEPPEDGADALPLAALSLAAGWRNPTPPGGYWELAASARLLSYFGLPLLSADSERLDLQAGLPLGRSLVELGGGLDASAMGDGEDPAHLHPRWQAGLRLGPGDFQGILTYRGSYLYQPDDVEDFLYQGLSLGAEWERSLRLGLSAGLDFGWEYWPDWFLLNGAGASTGVPRQDVLGGLRIGLDGLAGFFLDWSLEASTGLRWSTANRYPSLALGLEEGSENSLYAALRAEADWSPHRSVGLQLGSFLRQEWYLTRAALTAASVDTGETLRVLSLGLTARADWTPNNRLFLVLEGSLGRRFANDPAEERWNASMQAGLEYSF